MHLNAFTRIVLPLGIALSAALAAGCGSRASVVCDLICDCEHCNDQDEALICVTLDTQEEVSAAYNCSERWDAWTVCMEEKGRCDEDSARYRTSIPGSCLAEQTCAGGLGDSCDSDIDCVVQDSCSDEESALNKCINDASGHGGTDVDFD